MEICGLVGVVGKLMWDPLGVRIAFKKITLKIMHSFISSNIPANIVNIAQCTYTNQEIMHHFMAL